MVVIKICWRVGHGLVFVTSPKTNPGTNSRANLGTTRGINPGLSSALILKSLKKLWLTVTYVFAYSSLVYDRIFRCGFGGIQWIRWDSAFDRIQPRFGRIRIHTFQSKLPFLLTFCDDFSQTFSVEIEIFIPKNFFFAFYDNTLTKICH